MSREDRLGRVVVVTWPLAVVLAWGLPGLQAAPRPATPIIGGEQVGQYEWTNVVAVLSDDPDTINTAHLCSGTLIAPQIVLTAGHCIDPDADPTKILVFFGNSIYGDQVATVERFEIFPDACVEDCKSDAYDFAFVEIHEKIGGVEILPLLTDQAEWDETMATGKPVTFVGFGAIRDDGEDEPPLKMDELGYKQVVETKIAGFSESGREFVAGAMGEDTCSGDSGGPAFVQLASGEWRQVGVTSRGVRPCGRGLGYYGVPFFVLEWLRDEAGVDQLPNDCEDYACLDPLPDDKGCGCEAGGGAGLWIALLGLIRRRRRSPARSR